MPDCDHVVGDRRGGGGIKPVSARLAITDNLRPNPRIAAPPPPIGILAMLNWAVTFLVVAIVAALFGFGVIASTAASFAKILFFVFLVLAVASYFVGGRRGRGGPPVA